MQNRKNLHDYGLVLILFGILNLYMFVSTVVVALVDGSMAAALATVEPDILVAVKVVIGILGGFLGLLAFADALIGAKAMRVSENPTADKGYIFVAKIFFVVSAIATISSIVALIDGKSPIIDTILNLANSALGTIVYFLFIKAAQAVRLDVLKGEK